MRNKTNRFLLLVLLVVVVALAIYAYPSASGILTLLGITAAIIAVIAILALLIAGTFNRRPVGIPVILVLAILGVIGASWSRISARLDVDRLSGEIREAGDGRLIEAVTLSTTRSAEIIRQIQAVEEIRRAELNGIVAGPDAELAGFFETPAVLDLAAVTATSDRLSLLLANSANVPAEIERITGPGVEPTEMERIDETLELAEWPAEVYALDIRLPDSPRLLLLAEVRSQIAADRERYLALAAANTALISVLDRMAAYLRIRPGEYTFDEETRRARFADLTADEGYMQLLIERDPIVAQLNALRTAPLPDEAAATMALVNAIGAPP